MKIVCDNCATKYSIADEKVKGKVFKIRCKKCSHIIVVRGGEGAGDAPADAAAPSRSEVTGGNEAVWHLVIDREQIGPITAEEVRGKFAAGEIDVETYSWREGFADWLRLGSIEDFADLAKSAPAGNSAAAEPAPAAPAPSSTKDLFGGEEASDLFGGSSSSTTVDQPDLASGGLFGGGGGNGAAASKPEPMAAGAAAEPAPAPAPRAKKASSPAVSVGTGTATAESADSPKMTGQRNENSMLFSLNSLQSMATGGTSSGNSSSKSNREAPPSSSSGGGGNSGVDTRPGFANSQSEGSGLIDIRAMAASTLKKKDDREDKASADMPTFSAPPVFSPVATPILMPSAPQGAPSWLWPVVGLGAFAFIAIIGLGVMFILKKPEAPVATGPTTAPTTPTAATGPAPTAAPNTPPANPTAAPPANPTAAPPTEAKEEKGSGKKHEHGEKKNTGTAPEAAKPEVRAKPETPSAPPPERKKKGGDAIDDLLNSASPGGKEKPEAKRGGGDDDNLPEQLDKGAIVGGMSKVKGNVATCFVQFKVPGVASVSVTIGKSGKVQSANVTGQFEGTPTGGCIEKAVKGASFPQFKGPSQTVNYPFMLR